MIQFLENDIGIKNILGLLTSLPHCSIPIVQHFFPAEACNWEQGFRDSGAHGGAQRSFPSRGLHSNKTPELINMVFVDK